jgi:5S rRNA maturation endonuclease (ribonuclease M5)
MLGEFQGSRIREIIDKNLKNAMHYRMHDSTFSNGALKKDVEEFSRREFKKLFLYQLHSLYSESLA